MPTHISEAADRLFAAATSYRMLHCNFDGCANDLDAALEGYRPFFQDHQRGAAGRTLAAAGRSRAAVPHQEPTRAQAQSPEAEATGAESGGGSGPLGNATEELPAAVVAGSGVTAGETALSACDLCRGGHRPTVGPNGYLRHMFPDGDPEPCYERKNHILTRRAEPLVANVFVEPPPVTEAQAVRAAQATFGTGQLDYSCRKCGKQCDSAPYPPARAICEDCCPDHDYRYEREERKHRCVNCGREPDPDFYYDEGIPE